MTESKEETLIPAQKEKSEIRSLRGKEKGHTGEVAETIRGGKIKSPSKNGPDTRKRTPVLMPHGRSRQGDSITSEA